MFNENKTGTRNLEQFKAKAILNEYKGKRYVQKTDNNLR